MLKMLMRLEQRHTAWTNSIVQKFTRPANLVLDGCAETFSVTMASLLIPKHRGFIKCKVDTSCVAEAMLQLILLYARQFSSN